MTLTTNKQIVQEFYDSANRGDMETCMGQLADDVTWTNIGSTKYSGTFHGKADLVARLLQPVFGQLQAGITSAMDNMIAEGDFVVGRSRAAKRRRKMDAPITTLTATFSAFRAAR